MAWAPSTNFEDDLVDLQPDFNLIYGQLAYEANRIGEYTPRPKSTYEYLAKREKRNLEIEKVSCTKTKEISAGLVMMERIQEIAGTKPLGEHATLADWNDESTVDKEAVAMMRHFGMMSMANGSLSTPKSETLPQGKIHVMRNGNRRFPLILDPSYFEPGRTRKNSKLTNNLMSSGSSTYTNLEEAASGSTDSMYSSAKSHLDDTISSKDSYVDIPYERLQASTTEPESQQSHNPKKNQQK